MVLWLLSCIGTIIIKPVFLSAQQLLPDTYKDIFVNPGPRPTLGTTRTTCWARGGVCVDLRECPQLIFDGNVPGCMYGFKVCCKSFKRISPHIKGWRRWWLDILPGPEVHEDQKDKRRHPDPITDILHEIFSHRGNPKPIYTAPHDEPSTTPYTKLKSSFDKILRSEKIASNDLLESGFTNAVAQNNLEALRFLPYMD